MLGKRALLALIPAYRQVSRTRPGRALLRTRAADWLRIRLVVMEDQDVLQVLGVLAAGGVQAWVAGGWGVDALVGIRTRRHHDVDLVVDGSDGGQRAVDTLCAAGFQVHREGRGAGFCMPRRRVLHDGRGHVVDVLPVDFTAAPFADRGSSLDPAHRDFAAEGRIGGHPVACLSAAVQIACHEGYRPRLIDERDVARLRALLARDEAS